MNFVFSDARRTIPRLVHAYWCAVLTQDEINKYPNDFKIESESVRLLAPDQSILDDAKENDGTLDGAVRPKRLKELKNPHSYERLGFTHWDRSPALDLAPCAFRGSLILGNKLL